MSGAIHVYETCRIKDCEDTYGKYGIKPLYPNKPNGIYYIWWHDEGDPDLTRRTLKTRDFQTARRKMIAWAEGLQVDYLGGNPLFVTVLTDYLATLPQVHAHRTRARMLFPTLEQNAAQTKFSQIYEARQKLWMLDLKKRGYASKTIAVCMALVSKVISWATAADEDGLRKCRPVQDKIIVKEKAICHLIEMPVGMPDNWHPEPEGMVRLIIALQPYPDVLRWLLVMLTFGCRVQAACEATGEQLRWSQYDLNPPGRMQAENKWRPELPVAPSALREFRTWGEGRWVLADDHKVGTVFRSIRQDLGMPGLKPSSIRDYVATMLRHAHVDFQVRYIHKEEQETWQGHRRDDTHGRYGKYRPDYMVRSVVATEAMLRDLDLRSGGGLFRQGPDKAELNSLSEQEDVEKSREVPVSDRTELPRETTIYLGPRQDKTGEFGPLQGDFRQVSDNKIRHPDGTIDALGTFGRVPLEKRLAAHGIQIFETARHDPIKSDPDTYLVATGSNQIPAVRAGRLKSDPINIKKSKKSTNEYYISADTGREYVDALRKFEIEMTEIYNACRDDDSFQDFEIRFENEIRSVVFPVLTGMPSYKPTLDFDNMTEAEIEEYVESRLKIA